MFNAELRIIVINSCSLTLILSLSLSFLCHISFIISLFISFPPPALNLIFRFGEAHRYKPNKNPFKDVHSTRRRLNMFLNEKSRAEFTLTIFVSQTCEKLCRYQRYIYYYILYMLPLKGIRHTINDVKSN